MNSIEEVAPAFVKMAHEIVWCSAASVDAQNRPRSRVLHPIWEWDGERLTGWVATGPTPTKRANLAHSPYLSVNYWATNQDTCVAECEAKLHFDDDTRLMVWNKLKEAPPPVGYDPGTIPSWVGPTDDSFAALELTPWRLRVMPGTVLMRQGGEVLTWSSSR